MKRVGIIGGGMAGCAAAHQFHRLGGWTIDIYEGGESLGAGVRTHFSGGHPFTFGPRHFLTKNQGVYEYLNQIIPMRLLKHKFLTYLEEEKNFFSYPINMTEINLMERSSQIKKEISDVEKNQDFVPNNFEEYWISKIGNILYDKFINEYSKKMWMLDDNKEIDTFNWSPKGTPLKKDQTHAWSEAISAYPIAYDGYNKYFDDVYNFANVYKKTKVEYLDQQKKEIKVLGEKVKYDIVVNTVSLDDVLRDDFGSLPYVGRDLTTVILPIENAFPKDVFFLYYANKEPYTRIVEYKKLSQYKSESTILGIEKPSKNGKHYPLPIKKYREIHDLYYKTLGTGVYSIGRAGKYDYQVDIDDCIEQALNIYNELK